MPTVFQVEEMYGEEVVSSGAVVEDHPMKAAEVAAGQKVSPRALQDHWFRVVDEDNAAVYEYSLAEPGDRPHSSDLVLSDRSPPIAGHRHEGDPVDEHDNFYICPTCGQQVDLRDLRQVVWHERPKHKPLLLLVD